jgi:hypothetical protein
MTQPAPTAASLLRRRPMPEVLRDVSARLLSAATALDALASDSVPALLDGTADLELTAGLTVYGVERFAAQVQGDSGDVLLFLGDTPREMTSGNTLEPRLCRYNAEKLWRLLEAARLRGVITPAPVTKTPG